MKAKEGVGGKLSSLSAAQYAYDFLVVVVRWLRCQRERFNFTIRPVISFRFRSGVGSAMSLNAPSIMNLLLLVIPSVVSLVLFLKSVPVRVPARARRGARR
jgi:hypothetical protein